MKAVTFNVGRIKGEVRPGDAECVRGEGEEEEEGVRSSYAGSGFTASHALAYDGSMSVEDYKERAKCFRQDDDRMLQAALAIRQWPKGLPTIPFAETTWAGTRGPTL